jgi:hypothetical protein
MSPLLADLIFLCVVLSLLACGEPTRPGKARTRKESGMQVELHTDSKRYHIGETVELTLVCRHEGEQPLNALFRTGQTYDLVVTREGKAGPKPSREACPAREVWRWSRGRVFTMALRHMTFQPRWSAVYEEVWDGKDAGGAQVPEGKYEIVGELVCEAPAGQAGFKSEAVTVEFVK